MRGWRALSGLVLCSYLFAPAADALSLSEVLAGEDAISHAGYVVTKTAVTDKGEDYWVATVTRNGVPQGNFGAARVKWMIDFGLFPVLGGDENQLVIQIFSGGAHCCYSYRIIDLTPDFRVIYDSDEYSGAVGYDLKPMDMEGDGILEFTQTIMTFDYFDRLSHARSPLPTVVFKYDTKRHTYLPANNLFPGYVLDGIDDFKAEAEKLGAEAPATATYDDSSGEYLSAMLNVVLRYIYAGERRQAWAFYEMEYKAPDKAAMQTKLQQALDSDPVYRATYHLPASGRQ